MLFIRNYDLFKGACVVITALISGHLHAQEVRYVSGQLTLKMYKDPTLSQALPSLKTGDRVLVLERDDGYAQVKMDDGAIGWVKHSYLEKEQPASARLARVQKELDALRSRHADLLAEEPVAAQDPDEQLLARVEAAEASWRNMKLRMRELESERMLHIAELRELNRQKQSGNDSKYVLLWIILPVLGLIVGFFIGRKYLEGKVKSRFGGYNPL